MIEPEQSRTRVKICGVTNRADAEAAISFGADALGFNLFAGSKRRIDLEREAHWIGALPPFVSKVAVLVNVPLEEARRIAEHPAIDLVQFHGDEDEEYCARFAESGRPFIRALRLASAGDLEKADRFSTPDLLVDAHVPGAYGGTCAKIDLELARELGTRCPELRVILAGGLTPANVGEAVRLVRPFAVDVASGVESAPGSKDPELMRAFVRSARGTD